ncbi:MAG: hypothetical protein PHU51_05535 [Candidatus Nanoarchaeia archaeon]|nr:hypothetical protein [Candidatus Nanoarchaeia archaeon]
MNFHRCIQTLKFGLISTLLYSCSLDFVDAVEIKYDSKGREKEIIIERDYNKNNVIDYKLHQKNTYDSDNNLIEILYKEYAKGKDLTKIYKEYNFEYDSEGEVSSYNRAIDDDCNGSWDIYEWITCEYKENLF